MKPVFNTTKTPAFKFRHHDGDEYKTGHIRIFEVVKMFSFDWQKEEIGKGHSGYNGPQRREREK